MLSHMYTHTYIYTHTQVTLREWEGEAAEWASANLSLPSATGAIEEPIPGGTNLTFSGGYRDLPNMKYVFIYVCKHVCMYVYSYTK